MNSINYCINEYFDKIGPGKTKKESIKYAVKKYHISVSQVNEIYDNWRKRYVYGRTGGI